MWNVGPSSSFPARLQHGLVREEIWSAWTTRDLCAMLTGGPGQLLPVAVFRVPILETCPNVPAGRRFSLWSQKLSNAGCLVKLNGLMRGGRGYPLRLMCFSWPNFRMSLHSCQSITTSRSVTRVFSGVGARRLPLNIRCVLEFFVPVYFFICTMGLLPARRGARRACADS